MSLARATTLLPLLLAVACPKPLPEPIPNPIPNPLPVPPDGGCPLGPGGEELFWKSLVLEYQDCLRSHSTDTCRTETESLEWWPVTPLSATTTELHGTVAPGGSVYPSPERAPEGDMCLSHDDLDWNFNVLPAPGGSLLLQPANDQLDSDHPDAGVVEAEWELMYVDPSYVAKPPGSGSSYLTWPPPSIDMQVGDLVALRGGGVLDCGHAPNRGELHPPYLLMWGGPRDGGAAVFVRATAQLGRPADFRTLPSPPSAAEALTADFPLPPAPDGGTLVLTTSVDWFLDDPSIVVDQGCNLANGVDVTTLEGPAFAAALASPAAHLVAANQPSAAPGFFTLTADAVGGALRVTLTPVQRPHQAVLGATIRAGWVCGVDGGC